MPATEQTVRVQRRRTHQCAPTLRIHVPRAARFSYHRHPLTGIRLSLAAEGEAVTESRTADGPAGVECTGMTAALLGATTLASACALVTHTPHLSRPRRAGSGMAVECVIPEEMEVVEDKDENPLLRYALILPFFFWGSSMVAMKVRRRRRPANCRVTYCGGLPCVLLRATISQHSTTRTANHRLHTPPASYCSQRVPICLLREIHLRRR